MHAFVLCPMLIALTLSLAGCPRRSWPPAGATQEPTNARFLDRFAGDGNWFGDAIVAKHGAWPAFAVTRPIDGRDDLVVMILLYSPPADGQPLMQLKIAAKGNRADGLPGPIDPLVVCDLNKEQADFVISNDVPKELAAAMLAQAVAAGISTEGDDEYGNILLGEGRFMHVDPTPFFAALPP